MLTKETVTGSAALASAVLALTWPGAAYCAAAGFYVVTLAMLLADRPKGELFAPPDLDDEKGIFWSLQPRWVKAYVTWIGFPAWLLLAGQIGVGTASGLQPFLIGAFAGAALLEMIFIARAYWRMDI